MKKRDVPKSDQTKETKKNRNKPRPRPDLKEKPTQNQIKIKISKLNCGEEKLGIEKVS